MLNALKKPRNYVAYVFMFSAMAVLILGLIIPLYNAVELSFYDWSMGTPWEWETREFLGFDAYVRVFNDEAVYQSVSVTLRYTFWVLVTEMVLGLDRGPGPQPVG